MAQLAHTTAHAAHLASRPKRPAPPRVGNSRACPLPLLGATIAAWRACTHARSLGVYADALHTSLCMEAKAPCHPSHHSPSHSPYKNHCRCCSSALPRHHHSLALPPPHRDLLVVASTSANMVPSLDSLSTSSRAAHNATRDPPLFHHAITLSLSSTSTDAEHLILSPH